MKLTDEISQAIAKEIESDASPVGIDAKKTHIIIIHMLREIIQRIERIEARLDLDQEK